MIKQKLRLKWKILLFVTIVITLLLLYSIFICSRGFIVNEHKIVNKSLPNSFYGLKIVHFSDLYYGKSVNEKELKKIVSEINLNKPDIVVFSGDLIDKDTKYTEEMKNVLNKYLSKINYVYGKYYVNGDNDRSYYEPLMTSNGFTSINNLCTDINSKENEKIELCGMSTKYDNSFIKDIDESSYKIMVTHYPDYYRYIESINFNLVLGGHSYNGQITIPFVGGIIKKNNAKSYYEKYYKINNSDFYISNGLGTDNIGLRLFDKPSFNLYRLVDK